MAKKEKKLSLRKQWKRAWRYLGESRKHIFVVLALFFVSAFLGYVFSPYLGFIDEILREIIGQVEGLNGFEITAFILQNNVQSAFFGMLLGIFLGIPSLINAFGNGVILGYVSKLVISNGSFLDLWALLPHGIFELFAIFIALGMGLKLGGFIFVKRGRKIKELKRRFYESMNAFLLIVLPLLVIAAVIEGILIALS